MAGERSRLLPWNTGRCRPICISLCQQRVPSRSRALGGGVLSLCSLPPARGEWHAVQALALASSSGEGGWCVSGASALGIQTARRVLRGWCAQLLVVFSKPPRVSLGLCPLHLCARRQGTCTPSGGEVRVAGGWRSAEARQPAVLMGCAGRMGFRHWAASFQVLPCPHPPLGFLPHPRASAAFSRFLARNAQTLCQSMSRTAFAVLPSQEERKGNKPAAHLPGSLSAGSAAAPSACADLPAA